MPTPQFEEIIENSGFDRDAMPRWQMVALEPGIHHIKTVDLRFATGMNVVNQNPPVATITEDLTFTIPGLRRFDIEAVSPGTTMIDLFDPVRRSWFTWRLEIVVKANRRYKIAYNFVDQTKYDQNAISTQVHFNMNQIFEAQANLNFDATRVAASPSTASLRSIVFELEHEERRNPKHREWDRLVDWRDPSADFNVYFMPWDGRPDDRPTEMLARFDGDNKDIICPDGMTLEAVERALAHEIGRFLGCNVTHNERQRRQLMFRSAADNGDLGKFVRGGEHTTSESRRLRTSRFITKDCANNLNPTFGP